MELEEGYLKNNVVILLSLIHITYGEHIKKIYVHEIFKHCGGNCRSTALLLVFILYSSQRAKGPLKIFLVTACRPGINWP